MSGVSDVPLTTLFYGRVIRVSSWRKSPILLYLLLVIGLSLIPLSDAQIEPMKTFDVVFHELSQYPFIYNFSVTNLAKSEREMNITAFFTDTSFKIEKMDVLELSELNNVSYIEEFLVYDNASGKDKLIQTTRYRTEKPLIQVKDSRLSPSKYEKDYDPLTISALETKWFQITLDVPILLFDGQWGSKGRFALNINDEIFDPWWDVSYAYRKLHNITGSSASAQTDYQMQITVHHGSGSDSGDDVYLNSHSQSDFDDVRFTEDDGETLLDYWRQEYTPDVDGIFWVEVDSIPQSPGNATIYIYYGHPSASSGSNGDDTFLLFDEFDSDNWGDLGGGTHSVAGGEMTASDSGSEGLVYRNIALQNGIVFAWEHISSSTNYWGVCVIHNNGVNVPSGYMFDLGAGAFSIYYGDGASWSVIGGTVGGVGKGTLVEVHRYGSTLKLYSDGVLKATRTHATLTGGRVAFRQVASRDKVVDRVKVRKRVDPEPTHGDWGSEESNLVYATFYFNAGGILRVNNVTAANGTMNPHMNNSIFEVASLSQTEYAFYSFEWDSNSSTSNPYSITIPGNLTVWCYFSPVPERGEYIAVFLAAGFILIPLLIFVIYAIRRKH